MSNETVREVLMDVGKSAIGVSIAKALDIPNKLDMGDSFAMTHGSNGVLYAGVSDVINYASGAPSKLLSMDVRGLVDDVVFLSALSGATEVAKIDESFYRSMVDMGFSYNSAELLVESAVLSAGRFGMRYVDENPNVPDFLKVLRHPTRLVNQ